uniref:Uncharacterized protein n=1 Tax=Amphimedon queenslandica TaxID=400682 RepID=A0A1X7SWR6_AMPQE
GTFKNELSIRSCMQVRDSVITKTSEDSNNDPVLVENLDKWFCFAQSTSSGKVLGVFYGKGEEEWVVNFKKSIATMREQQLLMKLIHNQSTPHIT